jgi:hypothetical protein
VGEGYPAVVVSKLQSCRGSVLEVRQMIALPSVTQCDFRLFHDSKAKARLFESFAKN